MGADDRAVHAEDRHDEGGVMTPTMQIALLVGFLAVIVGFLLWAWLMTNRLP